MFELRSNVSSEITTNLSSFQAPSSFVRPSRNHSRFLVCRGLSSNSLLFHWACLWNEQLPTCGICKPFCKSPQVLGGVHLSWTRLKEREQLRALSNCNQFDSLRPNVWRTHKSLQAVPSALDFGLYDPQVSLRSVNYPALEYRHLFSIRYFMDRQILAHESETCLVRPATKIESLKCWCQEYILIQQLHHESWSSWCPNPPSFGNSCCLWACTCSWRTNELSCICLCSGASCRSNAFGSPCSLRSAIKPEFSYFLEPVAWIQKR